MSRYGAVSYTHLVDEINAAGGVNGITLKLDFQDDENNAQKANNAYNIVKDLSLIHI